MQQDHNRRVGRAGMKMTMAAALCAGLLVAQSTPPAVPPATASPAATLNQLMRGLFFPNSNVLFLTQRVNPAEIKRSPEPSTSSDPLTGVFNGWDAVETSALTLTDAADLLMTPGRKCSNGRDVPVGNADWTVFVNQLRAAGIVAYKAALTKDQDKMIEATEVLNSSCANCHNKYRARNRCQ